jgi:hypothetical protein
MSVLDGWRHSSGLIVFLKLHIRLTSGSGDYNVRIGNFLFAVPTKPCEFIAGKLAFGVVLSFLF